MPSPSSPTKPLLAAFSNCFSTFYPSLLNFLLIALTAFCVIPSEYLKVFKAALTAVFPFAVLANLATSSDLSNVFPLV